MEATLAARVRRGAQPAGGASRAGDGAERGRRRRSRVAGVAPAPGVAAPARWSAPAVGVVCCRPRSWRPAVVVVGARRRSVRRSPCRCPRRSWRQRPACRRRLGRAPERAAWSLRAWVSVGAGGETGSSPAARTRVDVRCDCGAVGVLTLAGRRCAGRGRGGAACDRAGRGRRCRRGCGGRGWRWWSTLRSTVAAPPPTTAAATTAATLLAVAAAAPVPSWRRRSRRPRRPRHRRPPRRRPPRRRGAAADAQQLRDQRGRAEAGDQGVELLVDAAQRGAVVAAAAAVVQVLARARSRARRARRVARSVRISTHAVSRASMACTSPMRARTSRDLTAGTVTSSAAARSL